MIMRNTSHGLCDSGIHQSGVLRNSETFGKPWERNDIPEGGALSILGEKVREVLQEFFKPGEPLSPEEAEQVIAQLNRDQYLL